MKPAIKLTHEGETHTFKEWADILGVSESALRTRHSRNSDLEHVFKYPTLRDLDRRTVPIWSTTEELDYIRTLGSFNKAAGLNMNTKRKDLLELYIKSFPLRMWHKGINPKIILRFAKKQLAEC